MLADQKSFATQFTQTLEKPMWRKISMSNAHTTESKALERSALNRTVVWEKTVPFHQDEHCLFF
jgi:hypothetical protein